MSAYEPIHRATQPDGYEDAAAPVLTSRVQDDDHDRLVIRADGTILQGDGTAEPTQGGAVGVVSDDIDDIVVLTQAAYDALDPVVATTLYVIVG